MDELFLFLTDELINLTIHLFILQLTLARFRIESLLTSYGKSLDGISRIAGMGAV